MKIRDTMMRAGRSLRHAKARTLLTSLAISVGAFTVTLALAAGAGGQSYANSLIQSNGDVSRITVLPKLEEDKTPKEFGSGARASVGQLNDRDLETLRGIEGIEEVVPAYRISVSYMTRGGDAKKYETTIITKDDQTAIPLAAGTLTDNRVQPGQVVIPEDYLGVLGFSNPDQAIGKTVTVHYERADRFGVSRVSEEKTFTVVAVDRQTSTQLQYQTALKIAPSDGKAIHDFQVADSTAQDMYYSASVQVKAGSDVEVVKAAIKEKGYSAFSLKDLQETLFQFINIVQWGAAGFGFLAILASVFGIINTQYISVLERTQQIGLMKALGARRRDVSRLFRYEAAWVGFLGGLIGTGLAFAVGGLNPWIASSLGLEEGTRLLEFSPITSVILIASLVVIAVAAGYFPARKAAKLDPIEALRTE